MANPNKPFGFIPTRSVSGCCGQGANAYLLASGHAETIATGDMVKSDGAGGIALAAAGDAILGCFVGVKYTDSNGVYQWKSMWTTGTTLKANTTAEAYVIDDPDQMYKVQSSLTIAAADIGQLINLDAASPDSTFGRSKMTINNTPTDGPVTSVTIGAGGSGYSAATVAFSGGGGSGAAGTVVLSGDAVASVTMTSGGTGYTSAPTVTFSGDGTGATGTAVLTTVAPSQFRIEKILSEPYTDSTGVGMTAAGEYAICEVKVAKHERGGSATAVEV